MELQKDTNRIYFEHLDVIRFMAAFLIVVVHGYEAWIGWYGPLGILNDEVTKELTTMGSFVDQFIRNLGLGVDIFFLISGFLITYILLEEKKKFGRISIKKFMIRRAFRIWPLYYFIIALTPFLVRWVDFPDPDYLPTIFFVNNFDAINTQSWSYPFAHFWSICVEEHFYLLWPFIIQFTPKKYLISLFTCIIVISILFRIYLYNSIEYSWFSLYLHTLSRIDVLVIGAIGAYFYSQKPFTIRFNRLVRYALLGLLILSLAIEPVLLWNSTFLAGFKKFYYIGIIAVLLLDYNFNPDFKHLLPKKSVIHYFGKVSYGIYMYSNILLVVIIKKMLWKWGISNAWFFFTLTIVLSIIVPIISYELFEKHLLKLNKKFRMIKTDR